MYTQNCAACHGETGEGDGVIAPSLQKSPAMPGMPMTGHETVAPIDFTNAQNMLGASDAILEGKIIRGGMGGQHDFRVHLLTNDPKQSDKTVQVLSNWVE